MKIVYSKEFIKKSKKITGKNLENLKNTIKEIKKADSIEEIKNYKKIIGYKNSYRIRVGNLRIFFLIEYRTYKNVVFFQYILNRGEAYSKKYMKNLRKLD